MTKAHVTGRMHVTELYLKPIEEKQREAKDKAEQRRKDELEAEKEANGLTRWKESFSRQHAGKQKHEMLEEVRRELAMLESQRLTEQAAWLRQEYEAELSHVEEQAEEEEQHVATIVDLPAVPGTEEQIQALVEDFYGAEKGQCIGCFETRNKKFLIACIVSLCVMAVCIAVAVVSSNMQGGGVGVIVGGIGAGIGGILALLFGAFYVKRTKTVQR